MVKLIANNKRAHFDFFIQEKFEAGIELVGSEVKSVRAGGVSLNDSFVFVSSGELFLKNCYIKPYEKSASYVPDSKRSRKLLLHKQEILKLETKVKAKGLTLVPTKVYLKNNLVKVEIGLAQGKKLFDKRDSLKEKSQKLEIDQAIKNLKKA